MPGIHLVMVIAESGRSEHCMNVLRDYQAQTVLVSSGLGTATGDMLRLLGLSRTEKEVVFALCDGERVRDLMTALVTGTKALAFSVLLSSISVPLFKKDQPSDLQKREGAPSMAETAKYEVLVVIANRGCIDLVMNAARAAGATGGTVIHARGSGAKEDGRFFGVRIADERDVFFIVTRSAGRAALMQSIIDGAGMHTPARAVVFSMPIQQLAGFTQFAVQEKD